ncbi:MULTISPECIES: hypothetical protein [unclassified Nocardioides]|uniref:hypothetical protein n=1 Tax=unclassified Nocardioides TaxID=2615069 RepID=UPI0009F002B3|nr:MULTISPECIES: hypothetical protein [unclassified Nocardioides]GAW51556.1 Hemolysin-type calcium-binding region [Nocardioides sp. PD653-B2]GAW54903.1 Hemolysin-type calcium-binding region [Nocardioides sp. PD653]
MRRLPLAAMLVLAVPLLAALPAEAAPEATCQGQPATIVGEPGGTVTGTDGPDVIVTNGAAHTDAGAGDDLVCITDAGERRPDVWAGAGDDSVVDTSARSPHVLLGAGDDDFRGLTEESVTVDAGDRDGIGHDVIDSLGGWDNVTSGVPEKPNDDVIHLGGANDYLHLRGLPTGQVDGGDGSDLVTLQDSRPAAWVIDLATGGSTVDGAPIDVTGFERYSIARLAWSSFDFTGSEGGDHLVTTLHDGTGGTGQLTARMGGGIDSLVVSTAMSGPYSGGAGSDHLTVLPTTDGQTLGPAFAVDLERGRYAEAGRPGVRISEWEAFGAERFRSVEMVGSPRADDLSTRSCRGVIAGGAGADGISMVRPAICPRPERHPSVFRARGERGDDVLHGSRRNDRLVGGPGTDYAWGSTGRDVCLAETTDSCERSRAE